MRAIGNIRAKLSVGLAVALGVALFVTMQPGAHIERDPHFVDPAPDTSVFPAAGGGFVERRSIGDPRQRLRNFRWWARRVWDPRMSERHREGIVRRYVRLSRSHQRAARRTLMILRYRAGRRGPTIRGLGLTDPRVQSEQTIVVCQPDSMSRLVRSLRQQRFSRSTRRDRIIKMRVYLSNAALRRLCGFSEIQAAVNAAGNNDTVVVMPGFYTEPTARAQPHNDPACADMFEDSERRRPAPSYEYHVHCPNDLSLIAMIGRDLDGNCIRCNVHIQGSGTRPEDVIVEGGIDVPDPGVSANLFEIGRGPAEPSKEVGIRVERADGAYIGNLTVRNVEEHGLYSIETDGMTFDRINSYYGEEYGHLSFVTDHLVVQDSDFAGSGDAGIYPGASPPSGDRINSVIRRNRSHHNAIGLSGSMGSSLLITENEFTTNSTGITLDSISRVGHPGFPQNSTVIRDNLIHGNNFDTYSSDAWVQSTVQAPIGAGIVFGGGNTNSVELNHIYDNWRWGTALISVPDIVTRPEDPDLTEDTAVSTSHGNRHRTNRMGIAPGGAPMPNGIDFWWDEQGTGNCWELNEGTNGEIVSDPPQLPDCSTSPNTGNGNPVKTAELVNCNFVSDRDPDGTCDWFEVPPAPSR